jgi:hypothetical protein
MTEKNFPYHFDSLENFFGVKFVCDTSLNGVIRKAIRLKNLDLIVIEVDPNLVGFYRVRISPKDGDGYFIEPPIPRSQLMTFLKAFIRETIPRKPWWKRFSIHD